MDRTEILAIIYALRDKGMGSSLRISKQVKLRMGKKALLFFKGSGLSIYSVIPLSFNESRSCD